MYDDLPDYDNVQYDSFYGSAPPEPELNEYPCDNDDNPGEFILERSRLSTDTVLCRDCVNTMGVEDDVMPLELPKAKFKAEVEKRERFYTSTLKPMLTMLENTIGPLVIDQEDD